MLLARYELESATERGFCSCPEGTSVCRVSLRLHHGMDRERFIGLRSGGLVLTSSNSRTDLRHKAGHPPSTTRSPFMPVGELKEGAERA